MFAESAWLAVLSMHRATVPTLLKHICFFIVGYHYYACGGVPAATADKVSRACLIDVRRYGESHPVGCVGWYLVHLSQVSRSGVSDLH